MSKMKSDDGQHQGQVPGMTPLARFFWRQARLLPLLCLGLIAPMAMAQDNPFAPAITVNGRVITNFELKQRIIFFSLLQPNADATAEARKSLIEDRLRQYAAEQMGIEVSPEEVAAGMENFAARVNLSADEFLQALAPRGVSAETFRDFVQTGILWRETERVPLPEKAFETLCALVKRGNHLVSKDELLNEIWADAIVEENNLDKNISLLRQVLGERSGKGKFIETVRGHGFRFVAEVRELSESSASAGGSTSEFQISDSKFQIENQSDNKLPAESQSEIENLKLKITKNQFATDNR